MSHPRVRTALLAVVVASVLWFAWSVFATSQGKVTALTANRGNIFTTGSIELDVDSRTRFLFDVEGLYPGKLVESCITVTYTGSVRDVGVRVHAELTGGTGLEQFVLTTIELGQGGGEGSCRGFNASSTVFDSTLAQLATDHPDYDTGAVIWDDAQPGDQVIVRAAAMVADDNAAQGLTTEFFLTVEARP